MANRTRHTLPDTLMGPLSALLATQTGLDFPKSRWADLERGMRAVARDVGMTDVGACVQQFLSTPLTIRQMEILTNNLMVGETYFFRDQHSFEALEQQVLPELIRTRQASGRSIRIWSAGCCTGEEPYSIAILLRRLLPAHESWHITLLATDINPRFLQKAAAGRYGEWSFRNTPPWLKARYFKEIRPGCYEIDPDIKRMVTFSHLNLAEATYPSLFNNTHSMDLILCRNVLIYFTADMAAQLADRLSRALVDGGWLFVSSTEVSCASFETLSPIHFPGAILYRKGGADECPDRPRPGLAPVFPFHPAQTDTSPAIPEPDLDRRLPARLTAATQTMAVSVPSRVLPEAEGPLDAVTPDPGDDPCHMARACADQGRLADAVVWCERALTRDKLNLEGYFLLATIHQEMDAPDLAEQAMRRVLYLDPDYIPAHFALAHLRLLQGYQAEARRYFGNCLTLLERHAQDEVLTHAEGMTAGRLTEVITAAMDNLPQTAARY